MSQTGKLIRDVLHIKKAHFFGCYGLGGRSKEILDYMRTQADVSAGIAIDTVQYEEANGLQVPIYRGLSELGAKRVFDRIYCDFKSIPRSARDLSRTFNACFNLCDDKGMVLLAGLEDENVVAELLTKHIVPTFWLLSRNNLTFDLLFKK